jgi:hypothetical protein
VDLRAGLDDSEKRKYRDSNSDPSIIQPVASRYTDYAIPAPYDEVLFVKTVTVLILIIHIHMFFYYLCFILDQVTVLANNNT